MKTILTPHQGVKIKLKTEFSIWDKIQFKLKITNPLTIGFQTNGKQGRKVIKELEDSCIKLFVTEVDNKNENILEDCLNLSEEDFTFLIKEIEQAMLEVFNFRIDIRPIKIKPYGKH